MQSIVLRRSNITHVTYNLYEGCGQRSRVLRCSTTKIRAGSPAGSGVAAQDAPAPALTPEEEFDLFGLPDDQNSFVGAANSGAASKPCCESV